MDKIKSLSFSARGEALIGQEMFRVLDKAKEMELRGDKIFHLELGNPRLTPPPEIYKETLKAIKNKSTGYTSSAGLLGLREEIGRHYYLTLGRRISVAEVVISPANLIISQFLDLVCDRGDRVSLFSPVFPTYLAASAYIGLDVQDISLSAREGFDLTQKDIDEAISRKPRAIIVNSANNPTGRVYRQTVLEYLAKKCDEQGIWLLSDETYASTAFGRQFFSLATLSYPRLVVMSSFSKVFSIPGYRIGYAIACKEVIRKLTLSNSTLFSCLPEFSQRGCIAGLRVLDSYKKKITRYYKEITEEITELMNSSTIVKFSKPDSAFYIFVDISRTLLSDTEFCELLLSQKYTAAIPGSSFGKQFNSFVRIALCGSMIDVKEGVHRFMELAEECAMKKR